MPGFVRSKTDEKKWSKAKEAVSSSKNKEESSFTDQDWALANHIFHKMEKAELLQILHDKLSKRDDDDEESDDYGYEESGEDDPSDYFQDYGSDGDDEGEDLESMGIHEFDPDEEQGDEADKWLAEHDPKSAPAGKPVAAPAKAQAEPEEEEVEEAPEQPKRRSGAYSDWAPRDDYSPEQQAKMKDLMAQGYSHREAERMSGAYKGPTDFHSALTHTVRPSEMSPKMMQELKSMAKDWLDRADRHSKIHADPEKNPMKHASGVMLQAHGEHTKDYNKAYNEFLASDKVKGMKGIDRHKAIQAWKNEWKASNPEYSDPGKLANITSAAQQAGKDAIQRHKLGVNERMQHIMGGGAVSPDQTFSLQEGMQHAGGSKGEEGYSSPTVADPAAAFAHANKDTIAKLRGMMKPEQAERFGRVQSARGAQGVKPKVIRRPGGQT